MPRKPKTQPSPDDAAAAPAPEPAAPDEAAVPPRRGRKAKTTVLSFVSPPAADVGSPAKAPGRREPGRKPKQAAGVKAASIQEGIAEPQGQAPREREAEARLDLTEADAPAAAAMPQADAAADSDPVLPGRDPVSPAIETAQSGPEAEASVPPEPAARWDRTTDRVQFDWPAIERVAAQDGPNQAVAKLLVAARAEGASSRWPF